jgi:hypothetical protein
MVKFFDLRFAIVLSEKVVIFYTIMLRNYQFFSLASKHLELFQGLLLRSFSMGRV